MDSTAFKMTPAMRERLAKIHQRGDDGKLTPLMELEIPQEPEFEMGGGGLYSTAGDYLKFVRMILNDGAGTESGAAPGNHRPDGPQQHGREPRGPAAHRDRAAVQRCRVLPGRGQDLGPELPDQYPARADRNARQAD